MTKFKIIETKQKIQEVDAKTVGKNVWAGLKILKNFAGMMGVNTSFFSTVGGFFKDAGELIKNANTRKYTADEEKVINALKQNTAGGRKVMKSIKKEWSEATAETETTTPTKTTGRTPEEEAILLKNLTASFAKQGYGKKADIVAKAAMKQNPNAKTIDDFPTAGAK